MMTNLLRNSYATFVALFIAMFALPTTTQAQIEYNLAVGGKVVTSDNCNDLSEIDGVSGTVNYEPKTKTLTLQDATIEGDIMYAISSDIYGLKIKVLGTNKITAQAYGIIFSRPTSIIGDGTLEIVASDESGINTSGNTLTVEGCTLNVKGGKFGIRGYDGNHGEDITVKNAKITAEGTSEGSIGNIASLAMEGCAIIEPTGAAFDESLHGVALNGALVKDKVVIAPASAPVTEYELIIAGTKVNDKNCNDLSEIEGVKGTVKYDPKSKTLTLEDATINIEKDNVIFSVIDGLTLKVVGNNTLKGIDTAIGFQKPMTITGGGTLNVESTKETAIYAVGTSLVIEDCTINAKGLDCGISGNDGENGEQLTIKNAKVTAEGKEGGSVCDFVTLTMEGCVITEPVGAAFNESLHGVALNGALVKDKVVIGPAPAPITEYELVIAGTKVNEKNCGNLSEIEGVDGTVKYDNETKTLTLENATINVGEKNAIFSVIDGLTLKVVGNNTLKGSEAAIVFSKPMTITGGGTLNVESTKQTAINAIGTALTIEDCTVNAKGLDCGISGNSGKDEEKLTVKKATISAEGTNVGSICNLAMLTMEGCAITEPVEADFDESLKGVALNGALVKGKVVITNGATAIGSLTTDTATVKQGIYTLSGVRLSGELSKLPKGVYIVNGKKVVKQ